MILSKWNILLIMWIVHMHAQEEITYLEMISEKLVVWNDNMRLWWRKCLVLEDPIYGDGTCGFFHRSDFCSFPGVSNCVCWDRPQRQIVSYKDDWARIYWEKEQITIPHPWPASDPVTMVTGCSFLLCCGYTEHDSTCKFTLSLLD